MASLSPICAYSTVHTQYGTHTGIYTGRHIGEVTTYLGYTGRHIEGYTPRVYREACWVVNPVYTPGRHAG